jgi:hypothetical protein
VGEDPSGRGRVTEGDEGEGIWWMDFIYLYEIEQRNSCNCFKWIGRGVKGREGRGNLTSVQCKPI